MSDAQYEVIGDAFPKWADKVEEITRLVEQQTVKETQFYLTGYLWGIAEGAKVLGLLSEADDFVMETIKRVKAEKERGEQ